MIKKGNLLSSSDYIGWNLKQPMYAAKWDYTKNIITFADCIS
jgi:hypothetical protein